MKKILFILISIPFLFLVACTGEEKEIYSGNSNKRLTEEEEACCKDLQGAENGWIMEYFPNTSLYGGYQLIVSFDEDGMATFSAEKAVSGDNTRKESGMYTLYYWLLTHIIRYSINSLIRNQMESDSEVIMNFISWSIIPARSCLKVRKQIKG